MNDLYRKIKISTYISWQKIDSEEIAYVYDIKNKVYYFFESVEYDIWFLIAGYDSITINYIIQKISLLYNEDVNFIKEDILSYINNLIEAGIIKYEEDRY